MKKHSSHLLFWLVLGSGLVTVWLLGKSRTKNAIPSMWKRSLTKKYGEECAALIIQAVRREHHHLLMAQQLPANAALRMHLMENILPGLALYRVLLDRHQCDRRSALAEVDELFRADMEAETRVMFAPLKILPLPFWLFKIFFFWDMKNFPAEGWDFVPVENSNTRVAFDARRCFYLDTLTKLGAPELTASFCLMDDVMAEAFPGNIRFVRTMTLGRGDLKCDFQYCYARGKQSLDNGADLKKRIAL